MSENTFDIGGFRFNIPEYPLSLARAFVNCVLGKTR